MRGSNGVAFKEGAMKCLWDCSRHAVTICCCYLRYLVRVALVSSTPNGLFVSMLASKTRWFCHMSSLNPALASQIVKVHIKAHHEGPYQRSEFLNPCIFRLRSSPSSLCLVNKIGFGASGHFVLPFPRFCLTSKTSVLTNISFRQDGICKWPPPWA